jgi:hypothetical protein
MMALVHPIIDFILQESEKRPILGDVLFIGKQETFGRELKFGSGINLKTMDWSPHFGVDIVQDLGAALPVDLWRKFDFIYDGGSLDNMFNPAQGIMNMSSMLRPQGRMLCLSCASSFSLPYTMFSPGWFYDYFEVNNFESWDIYQCSYTSEQELIYGPWKVRKLVEGGDLNRPAPPSETGLHWVIVAIGRKGKDSTAYRQPIQYQYRTKNG